MLRLIRFSIDIDNRTKQALYCGINAETTNPIKCGRDDVITRRPKTSGYGFNILASLCVVKVCANIIKIRAVLK